MLKGRFYIILFFAAVMIACYSFACRISGSMDINIGDTYYFTSNIHLYQLYSILLILLGLAYLVLDKTGIRLNLLISRIHIAGTLILFLILNYFNYMHSLEYCSPNDIESRLNAPDYNLYLINTLIAIILLQFLFIINIFVTIIKNLISPASK